MCPAVRFTYPQNMDTLTTLLLKFETWLKEHHPETAAALLPGLDGAELDQFEKHTGLQLPTAYRTLYQWKNGQGPLTGLQLGLFGGLEFFTLQDVKQDWDMWQEVFHSTPGINEDIDGQTSTPEGFIQELYITPGWLAFAGYRGTGDRIGIDLNPGPLGTVGQVINYGRDEEHKTVLSLDLGAFLSWYILEVLKGNTEVVELSGYDHPTFILQMKGRTLPPGECRSLVDFFPGFPGAGV